MRPPAALIFRGLAAGSAACARPAAQHPRGDASQRRDHPAAGDLRRHRRRGSLLLASQFIDYRAVEVGQPGYSSLPGIAAPPTVASRTAGQAHSYLLVPIAVLAACLAVLALRPRRRRLAGSWFFLGLTSLAIALLIDLPIGLDAGSQATRFAGARAVLDDGFYAELAAAADWSWADCSTMRGRAEYEPTCQEGPQAP